MRFVERAEGRPNTCAVFPHLGMTHRRGYIDTGVELVSVDPHIYVSLTALHEMCRLVDWPTPDEHAAVLEQRDALLGELERVTAERDEANREIDAIHVMRSRGWTSAKKPGRPKRQDSEREEVAA